MVSQRGSCRRISVLFEAFFILSIIDFSSTFEIQYDSLLLVHDATHKGNPVPVAFLSIEEGLVRAAEKPPNGVGTREETISTSGITPLMTFSKDKNVKIQW